MNIRKKKIWQRTAISKKYIFGVLYESDNIKRHIRDGGGE